MNKNKFIISIMLISFGILILLINIYGLTQNIRSEALTSDLMRLNNNATLTYEQAFKELNSKKGETASEFASRITTVISNAVTHIKWEKEADATKYNQLVPIWENYFLFFMGKLSGIPEYQKYHFADYKRSLKRGIGICNDVSMIMSQVLDSVGTDNKIVAFPGHVIVSAVLDDDISMLFDPDFGVTIPLSLEQIGSSRAIVISAYEEHGFSFEHAEYMANIYTKQYSEWDGMEHFMTKKYYFEKLAYLFKWPTPMFFTLFGIYLLKRKEKKL
jgi:hypothetical protein